MTSRSRLLVTPAIEAQTFASRATARASHPFTLAELVDDAASGHCGQRWTLSRKGSGTYHGFYESSSTAEWLIVRASVSRKGTWTYGAGAELVLTATDGTHTASSLADGIPDGLRGGVVHTPSPDALSFPRSRTVGTVRWAINLATLRGVLTSSTTWRFKLVATVGATAYLEHFQIEEAPRLIVDTAEAFGQLPLDYLPRGVIQDGATGLQRLGVTLEHAFDKSLRTYHSACRPEASPWSTTSAVYAPLAQDTEPGGVAISHVVRGRKMRGTQDCRVRLHLRYRTVGMTLITDKAFVRLYTGGSGSPYTATLTDTAGAWTDATPLTAYIKTSAGDYLDSLHFGAKTDSGTLEVSARTILDYPV